VKPGEPEDGVPLRWHELAPGGPGLFVPADPDGVLARTSEAEFRATDERMPYFATLWPAGAALAAEALGGPALAGVRLLDLGCGVGAAGIAAAWRGARVAFLDWEPRALALVRRSLARQGLEGATWAADWRRPPPLGRFDRIVAADVLYEARNLSGVVGFVAEHLAEGGEAWIADPGRGHAEGLVAAMRDAGLPLVEERSLPRAGSRADVRRFRFARERPRG
jgi:predicted nicotinamide N-methyase